MRKFSFSVWILLGTLLGIAVGTATSFLLPTRYEATVELQVVPCKVPERFFGAALAPPIQQRLQELKRRLLSRGQLTSIIQVCNLYPQERAKLPMEDVLEIMREDVRVWTQSENSHTTVYLSFRYKDRFLAKRVAEDLTARLMDGYLRNQIAYQYMTVEFLRSMLDTASRQWLALKQGKGADNDRSELRALDLEAARRHYESVRQKLSEAEVLVALFQRQMGEMLELTDPASLPERPVSPRREIFIAGGALGGLLASLVVVFVKKPGSRKPPSL
jgi:LPS O-antigen subunit length determinant protein (WzzB/FepE family)